MIAFIKKVVSGRSCNRVAKRLDFGESCRHLACSGIISAREVDVMASTMVSNGLIIRNTRLENLVWDNLSLPGIRVDHCEIDELSAVNVMMSRSLWCWSSLANVDFSLADLYGADFRAGYLAWVNFRGSNLRNVDFRHSVLENCDFTDAVMDNALIGADVVDKLNLTPTQLKSINICRKTNSEPIGHGVNHY